MKKLLLISFSIIVFTFCGCKKEDTELKKNTFPEVNEDVPNSKREVFCNPFDNGALRIMARGLSDLMEDQCFKQMVFNKVALSDNNTAQLSELLDEICNITNTKYKGVLKNILLNIPQMKDEISQLRLDTVNLIDEINDRMIHKEWKYSIELHIPHFDSTDLAKKPIVAPAIEDKNDFIYGWERISNNSNIHTKKQVPISEQDSKIRPVIVVAPGEPLEFVGGLCGGGGGGGGGTGGGGSGGGSDPDNARRGPALDNSGSSCNVIPGVNAGYTTNVKFTQMRINSDYENEFPSPDGRSDVMYFVTVFSFDGTISQSSYEGNTNDKVKLKKVWGSQVGDVLNIDEGLIIDWCDEKVFMWLTIYEHDWYASATTLSNPNCLNCIHRFRATFGVDNIYYDNKDNVTDIQFDFLFDGFNHYNLDLNGRAGYFRLTAY